MTPEDLQEAIARCLAGLFNAIAGISHSCDTGLSSAAQADECIAGCEALLSTVTNNLRRYKTQKNKLIPLHGLPEELFHAILLLALDDPKDKERQRYYNRLLPLRMVSSQWNAVITSTRSLWTFVPVRRTGCYDLVNWVTNLSNPLPLDVVVHCNNSPTSKSAIKTIIRNSSRWRSLDAVVDSRHVLERILTFQTPNLKTFKVEDVSGSIVITNDEPLFMGVLPRLENVVLHRLALPWDAPYLEGLRHLDLTRVATQPPSIDQILHILRSSPQLSELCIQSCPIHSNPTSDEIITLPELHILRLADVKPNFFSNLLPRISTPAIHKIGLEPNDDEGTEAMLRGVPTMISWLASNSGGLKELPFSCSVADWMLGFKWSAGDDDEEITLDVLTTNDGTIDVEKSISICSLMCKAMKPKSTHLSIGRADDDASILRMLRSSETIFPDITRLCVTEANREDGVSPSSIIALGTPQDVDGKFRWLYPNVSHFEIHPRYEEASQYPAIAQLVKKRWIDGIPGMEPPAPLMVLGIPDWLPEATIEEVKDLAKDFQVKFTE